MARRLATTVTIVSAACASLLVSQRLYAQTDSGKQAATAPSSTSSTIVKFTDGLVKRDGFLPLYWDEKQGKLYMEIGRLDRDLLYVTSLPTGLGSNDIGLDRGQIDGGRIVHFRRAGARVLMVQPNLRFRADTPNNDERRATEESFAPSVLWSFPIKAEETDRILVDATEFALHDGHDAAAALSRQGAYHIDADRSAVAWVNSRSFPRNTEIEGMLTFAGDGRVAAVNAVAASPRAVTLNERQSLIALPEPGFKMRPADPRAGYFTLTYEDFAAPLGDSVTRRFLARHRLEKKDPNAKLSDPVASIVYYIDRGAPEPIRTALMDGAGWWNQAFEAAGYRNAFRVELLPEGADPMDIRYNMVEWVPRDVRGWSYGQSVIDPRTGEILKGHVVLDARRARYDYLLAEGLTSPYAGNAVPDAMEKMVLARIRQLAAHEIGHTLGLRHNFHASAQGRSSVMDYPEPLVDLKPDGTLDLSNAYAVGIGEWDKAAITYGYQDFPSGTDEKAALESLLAQARQRNLTGLTDEDASGGAHPEVTRWDNGAEAAAELTRMMTIRRAALKRFGENAVRPGQPLAMIEEALVPLYLYHRYQAEATATSLGGQRYTYALRGDGQVAMTPVSATQQERALSALLTTIQPSELIIPRPILQLLPPRPSGYDTTPELFQRFTGIVFDAFTPAATAVDMTLALLLNPERDARLVEQHALDPKLPGLATVLDRVMSAVDPVSPPPGADGYAAEIGHISRRLFADRLMELAQSAPMPQVRAVATLKLRELLERVQARYLKYLEKPSTHEQLEGADLELLGADITRFLTRPQSQASPTPSRLTPPLGSPLGD